MQEAPVGNDAGNARPLYAVLMAGGAGRRLWPLGTPDRPKQFLTELADPSLYVQAARRAADLVGWDHVLVVTNVRFVELVREQTPHLAPENILAEPMRRDTAPAVILSALAVHRREPGAVMLVMSSDHLIEDGAAFQDTISCAVRRAGRGGLGTIGIPPTHPATGFGYLELEREPVGTEPLLVERFVEKPDQATAEQYVASGRYLWNAGIFVWRADVFLEAAARHLPGVHEALAPLAPALGSPGFEEAARRAFESIEAISVDYGIMEKAEDVWCVPAGFRWSDIGGWPAEAEAIPPDANGNRVRGPVVLEDAADNVVITDKGRPVVVLGVRHCIIVHGPGGTLVCDRDAAGRIKPLVEKVSE